MPIKSIQLTVKTPPLIFGVSILRNLLLGRKIVLEAGKTLRRKVVNRREKTIKRKIANKANKKNEPDKEQVI